MKKVVKWYIVISLVVITVLSYLNYTKQQPKPVQAAKQAAKPAAKPAAEVQETDQGGNPGTPIQSDSTTESINYDANGPVDSRIIKEDEPMFIYLKQNDTDRNQLTEEDVSILARECDRLTLENEGKHRTLAQLKISSIARIPSQDGTDHYSFTGWEKIQDGANVKEGTFHGEIAKENSVYNLRDMTPDTPEE